MGAKEKSSLLKILVKDSHIVHWLLTSTTLPHRLFNWTDCCVYLNLTRIWSQYDNQLLISATLPHRLSNCFGYLWVQLKCDPNLGIGFLSVQPYPTNCSTSDKTFPSSSLPPPLPTTCSLSLFQSTCSLLLPMMFTSLSLNTLLLSHPTNLQPFTFSAHP